MDFLSFHLPDEFIDQYKNIEPEWGFPIGGGNYLSELIFYTKYSRLKQDGTRERWYETCRRFVEGFMSILKDHCIANRTNWNENKALATAKDAYIRAFRFLWTPPGRGVQFMGTDLVNGRKNSAFLQNCAFLSTAHLSSRSKKEAIFPFVTLMEMCLCGIGVGFDTDGAGKLTIYEPNPNEITTFVVPDTREGWAESYGVLLTSYFFQNQPTVEFDYSKIRDEGAVIKGFGGVAPGPRPLMRCHDTIRKLFAGRNGTKITSTDIVDINNISGKAVVSGGNRRTAELALGDDDDKNFINLKNWELNPERMGSDGWGNLSNNSIKAVVGRDYTYLVDNIIQGGEPGFVWLELLRKYGRLIDSVDNRDYRVMGVNPCQPSWATILTPNGISTIGKLKIGDKIWSSEGWTTVINKWSTGSKDVYRYGSTTGAFYGTPDHKLVSEGKKIQAQNCSMVDNLAGPDINLELDPQDIMDGLVFGDGSVHAASNNLVHLYIGKNDYDYFKSEIKNLIIRHRPGLSPNAYEIKTGIDYSELVKTFDRKIPERYMEASPSCVAGFLRGLYSANGSVVANRITLKASSFSVIESVQQMLSSLGIRSYYTTNKSTDTTFSNGTYVCKQSYDLNISGDRDIFYKTIGFIQKYKMNKLENFLYRKNNFKNSFKINSVNYISTEEVFDITVDNTTHTYWSGGLNISNCGEQPLEHGELCTLVNTYPTHHDSLEDFHRTLKVAYLYAKAVTLLSTPWPETNEIMQRNRRIGLSMSGLAQFIEDKGWHELKRWMDSSFNIVKTRDITFSEWLGIRESIKHTTIKPDGTTGLLCAVTPGDHWPTDDIYIRRVRYQKNNQLVVILKAAGYHVEPDITDPEFTVVVELPTRGPNIRTEREVSIWEKVALAALCQEYWSNNAVSCTATFLPEEADQISAVLKVFDGRLKTISFLPLLDNGDAYQQSPYSRISNENYETLIKDIKPMNWKELYGINEDVDLTSETFCTTDKCELPRR